MPNPGLLLGGGSFGTILFIVLLLFMFGGNLFGGSQGGQQPQQQSQSQQGQGQNLEHCRTGEDANKHVDCRMVGAQNSLDAYWSSQQDALGVKYQTPGFVLYDGRTQSACGTASNDVGPFYCPADRSIYIDAAFFQLLEQQFGAKDGPMAQLYIVAHEWGHHMQYELGVLQQIDNRKTGPESDAVRSELQADCFAGAWAKNASTTTDEGGTQLIQPLTEEQIRNALDAAAAVGDDHIQEQARGEVNPEAFSHGSSEQRQRWFMAGYQGGWQQCDTFSAQSL